MPAVAIIHHVEPEELRRLGREQTSGRNGITDVRDSQCTGWIEREMQQPMLGWRGKGLRDWVHRFNAEGVEGLRDRPHKGRPRRMHKGIEEAFCKRVDKGPDANTDKLAQGRACPMIYAMNVPTFSEPYVRRAIRVWRLFFPMLISPAMNMHLRAISAHVEKESMQPLSLMVLAGIKKVEKLSVPDNITLIRLPSYSPELNAQENVWEYLRPNYLAGKVFDTYDEIVDGCCMAWNALIATPGKIKSIASRDWLNLQQVNL
ncbi:unnamed protein product [Sphagnum jensenii]|uniref:Tc1-like transposase DDE domain-containing protein n=1 Tax=Sphagnum jensenii TaxID=128206 RepID=A0ABP0VI11_9BRYO